MAYYDSDDDYDTDDEGDYLACTHESEMCAGECHHLIKDFGATKCGTCNKRYQHVESIEQYVRGFGSINEPTNTRDYSEMIEDFYKDYMKRLNRILPVPCKDCSKEYIRFRNERLKEAKRWYRKNL